MRQCDAEKKISLSLHLARPFVSLSALVDARLPHFDEIKMRAANGMPVYSVKKGDYLLMRPLLLHLFPAENLSGNPK